MHNHVLGHQPPLPGAAPVRFVQPEEVTYDGTMVPVTSYYKEETKSNLGITQQTMFATEEPLFVPEGQYQMDHNTLWFIANGGVTGGAKPQGYCHDGQRPYKPLSDRPLF